MAGYLQHCGPVQEAALSWIRLPNARLKAQGIPYSQVLSERHLMSLQADVLMLQEKACPFLGQEMQCQIYAGRPLACRSYGVTLVADEWCPRPLTAYETPNGRMLVGKNTPLGQKIIASSIALWEAMRYMKRADLATVGFLPMLVAEVLAPFEVKRLQDKGLIAASKMGKGQWALPNLFGGQDGEPQSYKWAEAPNVRELVHA